ncbi:MAG: von Willebrand factor type A domain-containing protein [Hyphomicrobiaceae bacterium]|nr:von Willebrand factor type A domain-containing protein [Hyphomicrobiaceae bacterium]
MTRSDLDKLKSLPVPPSSDAARERALAAAMRAYDVAGDVATETSAKGDIPSQGTTNVVRLTPAPRPEARRSFMSTVKVNSALAACLVTTAIAVPAALYYAASPKIAGEPPIVIAGLPEDQAKTKAPVQAPVTRSVEAANSAPVTPLAKPTSEQVTGLVNPPARQGREEKVTGGTQSPRADTKADLRLKSADSGKAEHRPAASAPVASGVPQPPALAQPRLPEQVSRSRVADADKRDAVSNVGHSAAYLTKTLPEVAVAPPREYRDQHEAFSDNPVKQVAAEPVSTFSIEADTASYGFVRRSLNAGSLPAKDAVRVEELINYFPYDYPAPETASVPFQPSITIAPAPWNASRKLVHIGIKGYALRSAERPRANLVFLIDTSGSMGPQDRLPLVKSAFRMLVDELKPDDTVAIVTYASGSGIALQPTKASDKSAILASIDRLQAGGSTAGAKGIEDAYALAEANFDKAGVNRIILATDGDFNVGLTNRNDLKGYVERKRDTGIFLSILGVGQGNYNDAMMQALAQNGNGTAAYVDTLSEARKLLVEEASSTLFPIAKDVKIQVEFNPALVSEYRLIGYETRSLKREDFNNDKVDAGEIGSGHTVTAIYEITPVGTPPSVDPLRYAAKPAPAGEMEKRRAPVEDRLAAAQEYGFFKMRYKLPAETESRLLTVLLTPNLETQSLDAAPVDVRFSVAVAAFGQLLRGSPLIGSYGYGDVITLAQGAKGADPFGYRAEFINLARLAKSTKGK